VKQAVVVPRENGTGDMQLVAYVVFGPGVESTVTELRASLRERLPAYMVPSSFAVLDSLPLTPNGKVDRTAPARLDARPGSGRADRRQSVTGPSASELEIAIVGMACRFPGAASVEAFWQNLRNGVESVSFFSDEELREAGVGSETLQNPLYVKAAAVLSDVEHF